jgi:hypothetical protein
VSHENGGRRKVTATSAACAGGGVGGALFATGCSTALGAGAGGVLSATRWSHAEIPNKQIPKTNEAQRYERIEEEGEGRGRVIFRFFKGILGFFGGLKENQGLGVLSVVNKFPQFFSGSIHSISPTWLSISRRTLAWANSRV